MPIPPKIESKTTWRINLGESWKYYQEFERMCAELD
ncbi:DUF2972 domain-containing protein [Helicobacter sp. UBA3407]